MTSVDSMNRTVFNAGKIRQVCVNRKAIEYNMKHGTNYPTAIVVENGKFHEYHTVRTSGDLSFDRNRNDLPAKVFIETRGEIVGFIDPFTNHRSFLNLEFPTGFWNNFKKRFYSIMGSTPVINCTVDFDTLKEELEKPKKLPEPVAQKQSKAWGC